MNAKLNGLIEKEVGEDISQMPPGGADGGWGRDRRHSAPQQTSLLFDHLIGDGEQRRWQGDAKRLGGLEVDH
jgi:hypothetical protein